jgi:hypothetical protein
MVNNLINVSQFAGNPPPLEATDAQRKIKGGPLYPAADVLALAKQAHLIFWTKDCIKDAQDLGMDIPDAAGLVEEAVLHGRFKGSEWCLQAPGGPWAACDAYDIRRLEWIAAAHKEMPQEYYLKFGINKAGRLLLLVSCHV